MERQTRRASERLVAIPALAAGPKLSYGGTLAEEYEYSRSAQYTIVVPVEVDGKQIAHVIAPYTEAELNKRAVRSNRKRGKT